jgi:predicted nucleic acid-binding protein
LTILVDTSAWVEFLRRTGSEVNVRLRELLQSGERVAITDVVIMELLQGSSSSPARDRIWGTMNWCVMLPTRPLFDYEVAADLYHRCRRAGFTPANSHDLLIAAVAIGKGVPLLAADGDFERIAAVSDLQLAA